MKCDKETTLKFINDEFPKLLRQNLKEKRSQSEIRENVKKFIDDIEADGFTKDSLEIAQAILSKSGRMTERDPEFFNVDNILGLLLGLENIKTKPVGDTKDMPDSNYSIKQSTSQFLDDAYGTAYDVREWVIRTYKLKMVDAMFVNRGSIKSQGLGTVKDNPSLNSNIRWYQSELFNDILNYLQYKCEEDLIRLQQSKLDTSNLEQLIKEIKSAQLYDKVNGKWENTGNFQKFSHLIKIHLGSLHGNVELLQALFRQTLDTNLSEQERNAIQLKLDAFNAYILLSNFDDALATISKDIVKVKDVNKLTGEDKYVISKSTSNINKTWRNKEDINVEAEADSVTKLILETTPLLIWQIDTPQVGKYLSFNDFSHIISKIKDLSFASFRDGSGNYITARSIVFDTMFQINNALIWNSLSEHTRNILSGKSLYEVVNSIRGKSQKVLPAIFELLSNPTFFRNHSKTLFSNFNDDEKNKMYSLFRYIFSLDSSSIYKLSSSLDTVNFYANIAQLSDSIFNVHYVLYYDNEGEIVSRTLIDSSIANIRRTVEQNINMANNTRLMGNFDQWKEKLFIKSDDDKKPTKVQYTLPNLGITATVYLASGNTTFIDSNGNTIGNLQQLWDNPDVIKYIDSVLLLNLSKDSLFKQYYENLSESKNNACKSLLNYASHVVAISYIDKILISKKSGETRDNFIKRIFSDKAPTFNYSLDSLNLTAQYDVPTLKRIAVARANSTGVTTASVVRDGEGNAQSQTTLSRLLGVVGSQFVLLEQLPESVTKDCILLNVPGLLDGIFTSKEFNNSVDNLSMTDMSASEMAYLSIVLDFIGGLLPKKENEVFGNGRVGILPSVNSDKGTVGKLRINLNVLVNGKPLREYNIEEVKQLIAHDIGTIYSNMLLKVSSDWSLVDKLTDSGAPKLSNDFFLNFDNFNNWFKSLKILVEKYKTPVNYIKTLVRNYNQSHRHNPIELIDQVHFLEGKGNLKINEAFPALLVRFNPIKAAEFGIDVSKYPTNAEFWNRKNSEIIKELIRFQFKLDLTENTLETKYIKDNYPNWINQSGNLVLATLREGNIPITSREDFINLFGEVNMNETIDNLVSTRELIINPILEHYNCLDYLFTQEWMISTVGSFIAHPHKKKSSNVFIQEDGHVAAQSKRNVSFTAAMYAFLHGELDTTPTEYNIAVIDDIKDYQGTIIGGINKIKAWDGATFVSPYVVILENNALRGNSAGLTKKQFVHFKNEKTGTGGIIKTAGFAITNNWLRNSPFLQRLNWRMTNGIWLDQNGNEYDADILHDYNGELINYAEGDNGVIGYFKENGRYYQILRIDKVDGSNNYTRLLQEVESDGTPKGKIFSETKVHKVNSNYALNKLFGGMWSMSLDGGKLVPSETSIHLVVTAMNSIGIRQHNGSIESQDDLYQPLKHSDIHYVPTIGAVKQGAANVNTDTHYFDQTSFKDTDDNGDPLIDEYPLDFQHVKMYFSGIQLDKEHHADESELSMMTQVISACAARGFTFDLATSLYDALSKSTQASLPKVINALQEYFKTDDSSSIQEVFIKILIDNLANEKATEKNFALLIADDIITQVKQGKEISYKDVNIPLSDNTVYGKVLLVVASYLTSSGIRYKVPGLLAVLSPSFGIYKLYGDRKYESFENPEEDLKLLLAQQVPVYDINYNYRGGQETFMGMQLEYVPYGSLISPIDGQPVGMRNPYNGTIQIDPETMLQKFKEKAWRYSRNSEPLNIDFKTPIEFIRFSLLHEAMHNEYLIQEGESRYDYETRINNEALKRFSNNISNIKLGRTYTIKSIIEEEVFDLLGNLINVTGEKHTENRLINTPADYRKLKEELNSGNIISIVEDVTVGRDLAAYNVVFLNSDGDTFQLWDIDSYNTLFELNELKNDVDDAKDVNIKFELVENYLNKKGLTLSSDITTEELLNDYIQESLTKAYRWLLSDLANLSETTIDSVESYNKMLLLSHNKGFYNHFARWVNVHFGTGFDTVIEYNGQLVEVTPKNFEELNLYISNKLLQEQKVLINGVSHSINKKSIVIEPYELILPKTFKTNFGFDTNTDLNEVANDKDYFIKLAIRNYTTKTDSINFTIELKNTSGDHTYILDKKFLTQSNFQEELPIRIEYIDGKRYRLDMDDDVMYEMQEGDSVYQTFDGQEVIVTENPDFYVSNMHYDSIKLSTQLQVRAAYVNDLLNRWKNINNRKVTDFVQKVTANGLDMGHIFLSNNESITLDNYKALPSNHWFLRAGYAKHSSFLKALETIAARIPAQGMQSFMPMKIVAFDNPDINNAYVSTLQFLLLGSDLDIDAVSIVTYDINKNGLMPLWSPYANQQSYELLDASMKLPVPTGNEVNLESTNDYQEAVDKLDKYRQLFLISLSQTWDKDIIVDLPNGKKGKGGWVPNTNKINLELDLNDSENIELLGELLLETELLAPTDDRLELFTLRLNELGFATFDLTKELSVDLINKVKNAIDKHNKYFETTSKYNLSKIINNYILYSMYKVSSDPVNLIQSHSPIDVITDPLKAIANSPEKLKEAEHRGSGTFVSKYAGIVENQVGKKGISICATAMKSYTGLTQYQNTILNSGDAAAQARLLLGKNHKGIQVGGKTYKTLANIKAKDTNTITNEDVLEALAQTTNDTDAVLVISAALSLSTDFHII